MKYIIIKKANKNEMSIYVENINVLETYTQIELSAINDVKRIISYCNDNTIVRRKGNNFIVLVPNNEFFTFHEVTNFELGNEELLQVELTNFIGLNIPEKETLKKNATFIVENQNENFMLPFKISINKQFNELKKQKAFFAKIHITNENFQTTKLFVQFDFPSLIQDITDFVIKAVKPFATTEFNKITIFNLPKDF